MPAAASQLIRSVIDALLPALFFLSPLLTCIAPNLCFVFLAVLCAALIVSALLRGVSWKALLPPNAALAALLSLAAYAFIAALWSADEGLALSKAGVLLGSILGAFAAANAVTGFKKPELRRIARAFAAGAFLAALYLLVEFLGDAQIRRVVLEWRESLRPGGPKHRVAASLAESTIQRNLTLLIFCLWPGVLGLIALTGFERRFHLAAIFFLVVAAVALMSDSLAAKAAVVVSPLVLMLAWRWPRGTISALAMLWVAGFVLALPSASALFRGEVHQASWLPDPARSQVIAWHRIAEQVPEKIWLGAGLRVKPVLTAPEPEPEQAQAVTVSKARGHSNTFLQTWYELGLVGALLAALAGAALILRVFHLPSAAQPFAAATIAASALAAVFAQEIWQTWLICGAALAAIYLIATAWALKERKA
jgi:hypothetical protein